MQVGRFNGVFKEIFEQGPNGDIEGLLQERLQIPLDKAEELAKRIRKECNLEAAPEVFSDKKAEETMLQPKASVYFVEDLSEREFERFMRWLLEELGFEIQSNQQISVGLNFAAVKDGQKICIHARKYPLDLRIASSVVSGANQTKLTNGCRRSIVAVNGFFSQRAIFDAENLGVELWDRNMIVQKIEEVKEKAEVEEESSFPPYKGTLFQSLLRLEDTKDFIIEPKANDKYELHLPGIRYPLLSFQAQGGEVVRCVFRIKYNEPVGEFDGEVLIGVDSANVRFGADGQEAYALIIQYLEQFLQ
jgi:HJR/Mrr/RecB family endonuclease